MSDKQAIEGAELWLDRGSKRYEPGELLCGAYRLGDWRDKAIQAVELSVLWYTAGQGEEDFYVHHFERFKEATLPVRVDEAPHEFQTFLPESPLSYDGQIVKLCWAVRLRGFFSSGRQRVVEVPFWLSIDGDPEPATHVSVEAGAE